MYLGINYSGMHDSAVALIDEEGELRYAVSEERRSRVKKDGRFPWGALADVDMSQVTHVGIPYLAAPPQPLPADALYQRYLVPTRNPVDPYPERWREQLDKLDRPILFHDHHAAHAAAGYYLSSYMEALVVTFDGGALNCGLTGAAYLASRTGLRRVHAASSREFEPLASLYSDMTAPVWAYSDPARSPRSPGGR